MVFQVNENATEVLINKMKELSVGLEKNSFAQLLSYDSSSVSKEPDIQAKVENVKTQINYLKNEISIIASSISRSYKSYQEAKAKVSSAAATSLPSVGSVYSSGGSSSGGSYSSGGSSSGGSSSGGSSSSSKSGSSENKNNSSSEKGLDINDLIADMLVSFGVSKSNLASVTKNSDGYVVSIKNPNSDGKWKSTDIKEYYITNGEVSGALTGDGVYVKIVDGELVIDKSSSSIYSSVFATAGTTAGGYFASNAKFNNESNKEIFKKFYPDATDEEFENFCDTISKSGEEYSDVAKSVIESYKDNIVEISEKNGFNYLVIEDNTVKVDYTSVATELYAYESSKQGISYADGMGTEITFNDSVVTDITGYLKETYAVDVDLSSFSVSDNFSDATDTASNSSTVDSAA